MDITAHAHDLRPCPFCGGSPHVDDIDGYPAIVCEECSGAMLTPYRFSGLRLTPDLYDEIRAMVERTWDRRAPQGQG